MPSEPKNGTIHAPGEHYYPTRTRFLSFLSFCDSAISLPSRRLLRDASSAFASVIVTVTVDHGDCKLPHRASDWQTVCLL